MKGAGPRKDGGVASFQVERVRICFQVKQFRVVG